MLGELHPEVDRLRLAQAALGLDDVCPGATSCVGGLAVLGDDEHLHVARVPVGEHVSDLVTDHPRLPVRRCQHSERWPRGGIDGWRPGRLTARQGCQK